MKNKLFQRKALTTSLFVLLSLMGLTKAWALDFSVNSLNYSTTSDNTVLVTGHVDGTNATGSLVIPETVTYQNVVFSVVGIEANAFYNCSGLTLLVIPNTITSIGSYAFYGCNGLTSLTIPYSVTSIGNYAFRGCSGLTTVYWNAANCSGFNNSPFYSCSSLNNVVFGNSVEIIPSKVLYDCYCTSLTIGNSVTSIGSEAFYGCSGLTSLTIGSSVTSIGEDAFEECDGLAEVHYLGDMANWCGISFSSSTSNPLASAHNLYLNNVLVTSLVIPETVTEIADYAFYGCTSLTSLTMGNSVTSVGERAFGECSGLTEVHYLGEMANWCSISFSSSTSNPLASAHNLYLNNVLVTSLVTPDTLMEIKNYSFYGCVGLTSLTIGNSVTSIGNGAFHDCGGLTTLTIPNSVTSIGTEAFYGCGGITMLTVGNAVKNVGDRAFYGCSNLITVYWNAVRCLRVDLSGNTFKNCYRLNRVVVGENVKYIPAWVFNGCSGLSSLTIGNSVASIGAYAFKNCSDLVTLSIPNSVTVIGSRAFYGCSGLTTLTIPNSVSSMNESFSGCSGLTTVYWNAENCEETYGPFSNCSNLNTVVFGETVEIIPDEAFLDCTGLTTLTIPNSVTSIGYNAFAGCIGLTTLTIPNSVSSMDESFSGCSGLTTVYWNAENCEEAYDSFSYCSNLNTVVFGETVEIIPEGVFINCCGLTTLTIPNSVTSIGYNAFYGCSGLTTVYWNAENCEEAYDSFTNCSNLNTVVFGETVEIIPERVFKNCSGLTTLTIPNSVASIGSNAFYGCSGLTTITIPNSLTSIGSYAFYGCSGFATLTIPNSVTSIGSRAFENCSGLTTVNWNAENCDGFSSSGAPFSNCSNLNTVVFGETVEIVPNYVFYNCSSLTSLTIPISVTSVGDYAFYGCSGLTEVYYLGEIVDWCGITFSSSTSNPLFYAHHLYINDALVTDLVIPETVTEIKRYAYYGCSGLTSLTIGSSVTSIGYNAFSGCSGLTTLTIPNSVTSIGSRAFENCSGLTTVNWNANNCNGFSSSEAPFSNCSNLNTVVFGETVEIVPNCVLYNCSSLTSLTIGCSVKSIGYNAFYGCSGFATLTIPNSVTSIGSRAFENCSGLTTVNWNAENCGGISSSGNAPFRYCSNLSTVVFGDSVEKIPNYAFFGCSGLTTVYWNAKNCNGFSSSNAPFSNCSNLNTVVFGETVEIVPNYVLYNCSGLTTLTIPNSVTSVGNYAFYGCSGLTGSLVIPNSVTTIGISAFRDCSGLSDTLIIGYSVASIKNMAFYGSCEGVTSFVMLPATPPTLGSGVFASADFATPVSVHCGSVDAYQNTNGWSEFTNFQELDPCLWIVTVDATMEYGGIISGNGDGIYEQGQICTLEATPLEGFVFVNWTENGEEISNSTVYSFVVSSDREIVANFSYIDAVYIGDWSSETSSYSPSYSGYNYSLSQQIYTAEEIGATGDIDRLSFYNKSGQVNRNYDIYLVYTDKIVFDSPGDDIVLSEIDKVFSGEVTMLSDDWTTINFDTPFPYNGTSNLVLVVDDNSGSSAEMAFCSFNTNCNQTILYYGNADLDPFNKPSDGCIFTTCKNQIIFGFNDSLNYQITGVVNPERGGVLTGTGSYHYGDVVTMTAVPNNNYIFENWTENGNIVSVEPIYSFTVTRGRTLVANFTLTNHWTPENGTYSDNMGLTGVILIDSIEQQTDVLEVGVFCGDECRGSAIATLFNLTNRYIITMTVYGEAGHQLTFKLFDHAIGEELNLTSPEAVVFDVNGYGTPVSPYVLNFTSSVQTQTTPLVSGWNWYSTYIEQNEIDGLSMLENSLGTNGLRIQGRNAYVEQFEYQGAYYWYGTLNSIANEQMYKVRTNSACNAVMEGNLASATDHPITINNGWNWIGYPLNQNVSVENAMAGFEPEADDMIKGRNGYATYIVYGNTTMWYGTLNTLEPGRGYMYKSNSNTSKTLTFQTGRGEDAVANITSENNYFTPNDGEFANNMVVTAVVDIDGEELRSEDYELAAFVGDECRGSAKLMYVEPYDRYLAFLMVYGEGDEEIHFVLTDGVEIRWSDDQMFFVSDAIVGTLAQPSNIHFGVLGVNDSERLNVVVYPNPSDGIFAIKGEGIRKIEVINAYGQVIASKEKEGDFLQVDLGNKASGTYVLRVITNNGTVMKKLFKK